MHLFLHTFFYGVLLGWGAAIPLGPMNIEMLRRNLTFGSQYGYMFGFGACSADAIYLFLLSFGLLSFLMHALILKLISFIGAIVIGYFGVSALRLHPQVKTQKILSNSVPQKKMWHYTQGLGMTLLNPYTILFWLSVSSQIVAMIQSKDEKIFAVGLGVVLGTVSWVVVFNTILKKTRHKFSNKSMRYLNLLGGLILLGFALFGLIHAWLI